MDKEGIIVRGFHTVFCCVLLLELNRRVMFHLTLLSKSLLHLNGIFKKIPRQRNRLGLIIFDNNLADSLLQCSAIMVCTISMLV